MERLDKGDPEKVGPWELIGRLGSGGMGEVFVASDGIQNVALKIFHKHLMRDKDIKLRLQREIETIDRVKSKNVVKLIGRDLNSNPAWIALEFVNGPNLKTFIERQGPLNLKNWALLAKGLLEGLRDVHYANVIHRDIKPSNIILTDTGPKIIDFGIAQSIESTSLTKTGLLAGSPAWLSPEQIHGEDITPATDIFSVGSLLIFAASGESPWGEVTTTSTPVIFNRILTQQPNFSALNERQKDIVAKLMQKEPDFRVKITEAINLVDDYLLFLNDINKSDRRVTNDFNPRKLKVGLVKKWLNFKIIFLINLFKQIKNFFSIHPKSILVGTFSIFFFLLIFIYGDNSYIYVSSKIQQINNNLTSKSMVPPQLDQSKDIVKDLPSPSASKISLKPSPIEKVIKNPSTPTNAPLEGDSPKNVSLKEKATESMCRAYFKTRDAFYSDQSTSYGNEGDINLRNTYIILGNSLDTNNLDLYEKMFDLNESTIKYLERTVTLPTQHFTENRNLEFKFSSYSSSCPDIYWD